VGRSGERLCFRRASGAVRSCPLDESTHAGHGTGRHVRMIFGEAIMNENETREALEAVRKDANDPTLSVGDMVFCGGVYAMVAEINRLAPGKHDASPIRNDWTAVQVVTDNGTRWHGVKPAIMSVALNKINAGLWQADPNAYDPQGRRRDFTFSGRAFTAHSVMGDQANDWPLIVREAGTGAYVATVSNWKRLPEQLAAHLGTGA